MKLSAWEAVEYNKDYSLHTNHRQNIHITESKKKKTLKFESAVGDNPFIKKECLYVYLKGQKNNRKWLPQVLQTGMLPQSQAWINSFS